MRRLLSLLFIPAIVGGCVGVNRLSSADVFYRNDAKQYQGSPKSKTAELALQYASLKNPLEKGVFCLRHVAFFFDAHSDEEFRTIFGDDVIVPTVTTSQPPSFLDRADKQQINELFRIVEITLCDETASPDEQAPPPWKCLAYYRGTTLVRFIVEPYHESK